MRIAHVANFYGPRSGGLRTTMNQLAAGYLQAGHEPVLVVPGPADLDEATPFGRRVTLRSPVIPRSGGYRVLVDIPRVLATLGALEPDRLEVSDRTSLRGLGRWARRRGLPNLTISHEHLTGILARFTGNVPGTGRIADSLNRRTAREFDRVVCTTAFAEEEFSRVGAGNVVRVPLGVDLQAFNPAHRDPAIRARFVADHDVLLVHCGRLSPEKRPERSVEALRHLRRLGVDARLVVAGSGPSRAAVQRRAAGLPVLFTGFLWRRADVAALLAAADVVIAPGPLETFGLAALEALASGTPVVVSASGALAEMIAPGCGKATADEPSAFADGVRAILAESEDVRRHRARMRAEEFPWEATVLRMLTLHGTPPPVGVAGR